MPMEGQRIGRYSLLHSIGSGGMDEVYLAADTLIKRQQTVRGTAAYMAPEQWKGTPLAASDQYALAIMAYLLLTGRVPFQGRLEQVMYGHLHEQPQPSSKLVPQLPKEIDTVLLRALAKQPEERFASISAFAIAFEQALHISGDLYATLPVSETEARSGSNRTITLPGERKAVVQVPTGAFDGQMIRLEGLGDSSYPGSPRGTLTLTIAIKSPQEEAAGQPPLGGKKTHTHLPPPSKPPLSKKKAWLLVGLVCLIVAMSSAGLLYFANRSRAATNGALSTHPQPATGTVQTSSTGVAPTARDRLVSLPALQ